MVIGAVERYAAESGARIAAAGGNVVDAVIAGAFAQCVVQPTRAGVGGGGVMLTYSAASRSVTISDFIGVAPHRATPDMFVPDGRFGTVHRVKDRLNRYGYLASLVPGLVRGLGRAYERAGSGAVSWAELLEPAIGLAADGFAVFPHMAEGWQDIGDDGGLGSLSSSIDWSEEARRLLRHPDGSPYRIGETLRLPDYAATLRRLAAEGPDDFYTGGLAADIVADFAAHGGLLDAEDLARFEPIADDPISGAFDGITLLTQGPPSVGPTFLELLGLMAGWDPPAGGRPDERYIARMAAAMRVAFTDRTAHIGDPRHVHVPLDRLLSETYLAQRRQEIDAALDGGGLGRPGPVPGDSDTTHISAVDRDGNAALLTHSVGRGSGAVTAGLGFMHNSHMNMFDPHPGSSNAIGPSKRPNSGGGPVIGLRDGELVLALGSPAGGRKATAYTQILMNHYRFGMSLDGAVNAARIHTEDLTPVEVDDHLDPVLTVALGRLGHELVPYRHASRVVAITRDPERGQVDGAADYRGDWGLSWA
jgi:gamma-glutamyltranspeptidase/glutathione hydrolase